MTCCLLDLKRREEDVVDIAVVDGVLPLLEIEFGLSQIVVGRLVLLGGDQIGDQ